DLTDQKAMAKTAEGVVEREGRIDVLGSCMASTKGSILQCCSKLIPDGLTVVPNDNISSVQFTAQASGRQVKRLGIPGSIVLTASMSGTITNPVSAYNASKPVVLQMSRSVPCELAPEGKGNRVNTI
ncbi:hypothetical protein B0H11DRAFT_1609788, partial [Mycena galericulata]